MEQINIQQPIVSVVIPTMNRLEKLTKLIQSIYDGNFSLEKIEIIVIDNSFNQSALGATEKFPMISFVSSKINLFSAGARNLGWKKSKGKYVFFIDDDNVLDKNCITNLVNAMEENKIIGVSAPLMLQYREKNKIWCAGGKLSYWGKVFYLYADKYIDKEKIPEYIYDVDFFPNSYMVRNELYSKGIFHDDKNFPHNWSEPDLCNRVKAQGLTLCLVSKAITWHDIGYSGFATRINTINVFDQAKSRILYRKKYEKNYFRKIYFFFFYFPATSLIYLIRFSFQKENKYLLILSHFRGIWSGLTQKL
jgi:hypothetical protein